MKRVLLLVFCFMLFVSSVYAASLDIKSSYSPGETAIITVQGSFLDELTNSKVEFLRGHVAVPFDYAVEKIGGQYYIWAIMPQTENNYTLLIKNISMIENGNRVNKELSYNFSIWGEMAPYSVRPGAIRADRDFEIEVRSNGDSPQTITLNYDEQDRDIILQPGDNTIKLPVSSIVGEKIFQITVGMYSIPAQITGTAAVSGENVTENMTLEVIPRGITSILLFGDKKVYEIGITNVGNKRITNIAWSYNNSLISISPERVYSIDPNSSISFNVSLKQAVKSIKENLVLNYGDSSIVIPLEVNFTSNVTNIGEIVNVSRDGNVSKFYCSELAGAATCNTKEVCGGYNVVDREGKLCCIGLCSEVSGSSYAWLGYLLIAAIIGVGIFFYYRYKKGETKTPFQKDIEMAEKRVI